jgi:hypothetical protein
MKKGIKLDIILFLTFMALKVFGITNWSWWWVTSPLWLPPALIIIILIFSLLIALIFGKDV